MASFASGGVLCYRRLRPQSTGGFACPCAPASRSIGGCPIRR